MSADVFLRVPGAGRERRPNAADTAAPPVTESAYTRARRA